MKEADKGNRFFIELAVQSFIADEIVYFKYISKSGNQFLEITYMYNGKIRTVQEFYYGENEACIESLNADIEKVRKTMREAHNCSDTRCLVELSGLLFIADEISFCGRSSKDRVKLLQIIFICNGEIVEKEVTYPDYPEVEIESFDADFEKVREAMRKQTLQSQRCII
jgi:hypothetical protein